MKDIVLGVLAGAIGATAWAGVVFVTDYEVGWIAWGVGALVGYGVALGNKDRGRSPTAAGVLAVGITVLAIAAGKYAAVQLMMPSDEELVAMFTTNFESEEFVMSFIADDVVDEHEAAGTRVEWPVGVDPENASAQADYPPGIWQEAAVRWDAMDDAQRRAFREEREAQSRANIEASLPEVRSYLTQEGFLGSFGPTDLIFFGLGMVTAWGVGSGRRSRTQVDAAYGDAMLLSMLTMMVADGAVEESEIATIRSVLTETLGADPGDEAIVAGAAKARSESVDLLATLRDLSPHLDTAQREAVVQAAIRVALADGIVGQEEKALVSQIAAAVDVSESHLRGLLSQFLPSA